MAYPKVGGVKRWQRSSVGLLCSALLTPLARSNVDQALLEKAEGLIKTNQFDEAYDLLEPWEVAGTGD